MDVSLAGKVALVTGTGPNIGGGLALTLARYGAKVACVDVKPEQASAAVERIERNGGEAMAVPADITSEDEVERATATVIDAWGKIDILVNCAGLAEKNSVLDCDLESFERGMLVNCTAAFLCTKHVARSMVDREIRGSIICVASASGWGGQRNSIAYCTSKGAVLQFVRAAAMDLAPYGIRVNSFTPVATRPDNPLLLAHPELDRRPPEAYSGKGSPMGEAPTPTDYGHIVAMVASDLTRLVTGCDFRVDGGALAKHWRYIPAPPDVPPLPLVTLDSGEV